MKVLFSAYTGLGNFILKTPALSSLFHSFPEITIDLLGGRGFGADLILKDSGLINKLQILEPNAGLIKKTKFLFHLRSERYDLIVLPFDACHLFILFGSLFFNTKKIVFHENVEYSRLVKLFIKLLRAFQRGRFLSVPVSPSSHEIDLNYDLIDQVIKHPVRRSYETIVSFKRDDFLKKKSLEDTPFLLIQPSAANGKPTPKVWDPKNFQSLVTFWKKLYPAYKIVLVGDEGDAISLSRRGYFADGSVMNLMGKTNFNELCNLINGASLIVAHDSGVMHIANALSKPLLALYGPTNYACTGPIGKKTKVLFSSHSTFQIMASGKLTEAQLATEYPNYECMSGIRVDDVLKMLIQMQRENYE